MMKKIIHIILILFLPLKLVAIETTQFKYPIGFGSVSPMIEVGLSYDDNIFSQDNGSGVHSSWIGILAPAVLWSVNSGLNQYRVKYGFQAGSFFDSHDDNYIDHRFESDAHLDFSLRHRLDLEFDFLKLHERRGTGLSDNDVNNTFIGEPDKYRDIFLKGTYRFGAKTATGNVELSLSHLDRKYTNHEDLNFFYDRKVDSLRAAFIYRFRPNSSFIIEANHHRIRYDDSPLQHEILDNDENSLLLGMQWEGSALTTGSAKIGYEKKSFKSAEYASHNFIPWELGLIWAPRSYSKVNLTTYSKSEETSGTG
ncbi:MAG: outer membrane beta-barrel protein, partial [Pseudomonadota bacterium]